MTGVVEEPGTGNGALRGPMTVSLGLRQSVMIVPQPVNTLKSTGLYTFKRWLHGMKIISQEKKNKQEQR